MWKTTLAALLAAALTLSAKPIKIHGYITNIESPKKFAIDDYKIIVDDHADFNLDKGDYPNVNFQPEDLRVGNEIEVQGDFNDSNHELQAASVTVFVNDNLRVKRSAVIEHTIVLEKSGTSWSGIIHADGQTIRVNDETHVTEKDLQSNQLNPGMSVTYEGFRSRDGSIIATRLEIFDTAAGKAERHLWHDGPAKVSSDGEILIRGVKYKLVPDAEAQSYVQRVGAKLVPAYYQKELSGGAARRDPFEFYLVANDDFNAHAFPNGTVLVNSGVFRVLANEAQLAAVLGHEIAHATQEHAFRESHYKKEGPSESLERGYAHGSKGDTSTAGYSRILENQADRIGLEYMVTAGYDPREAAEVWTQVAHSAAAGTGFYWDGHDDATTRRSYLLAELHNNYSGVNYQTYVRDCDEFDSLAQRFGGAVIPRKPEAATLADASPVTRPGFQRPSPPAYLPDKRYGANAVSITSTPVGADVVMNGRIIGKTPMTLPTGNVGIPYTITIQRAGYRSYTVQMVSVPGRTSLPVELFPIQ